MRHKVLHIITRWMKSGGAEKNTYWTVKGLDREKYRIDLAIGGDSEAAPEDLGVRIFKISKLKRDINLFFDLTAFFKIYSLIKKEKYQLVHTHQSKAGFLGRLAAKMAGTRVIVHTLHGPLFYEGQNKAIKFFYVLLEKFAGKFTDWFVSVGEDLKDYYLKHGIGKPDRYSIIRSRVNIDKLEEADKTPEREIKRIKSELGIGGQGPVVGMVGRLEKSKGFEKAIEVAKIVLRKYPKVKFLFVGKGSSQENLKKKVVGVRLQQNIKFAGFREDIERVMRTFDVLILTTPREGLSQVLVQAAYLGIPMVSFDVLGAGEMIKENGFVVKKGDIDTMAEKIDYLLSDSARAKKIGEKGKDLVTNEWRIETITEKNNQLYENLLK